MSLTFTDNLLRFPIAKRLHMTGRKPQGPAKIIILPVIYYGHHIPPLPTTPKRKNVRPRSRNAS